MAILKDALVQGDLVTTGNIRGDELSVTQIEVSKGVANENASVTVERSDTGVSLFLGIGSGGTNHGVYSNKLDKWLVYGDASSVHLNGNAETASTLSATLSVGKGGTGATTLTSGAALIGNGTSAITTRSITNNTATSTAITANTNLITANTLRYAINRTTSVAAADTNYTTYMARGMALNTSDTNPTVNGAISWTYK